MGRPDPLAAGLVPLDEYVAGLGLTSGWLVIFDLRPGAPPIAERKAVESATSPAGWSIVVVRG